MIRSNNGNGNKSVYSPGLQRLPCVPCRSQHRTRRIYSVQQLEKALATVVNEIKFASPQLFDQLKDLASFAVNFIAGRITSMEGGFYDNIGFQQVDSESEYHEDIEQCVIRSLNPGLKFFIFKSQLQKRRSRDSNSSQFLHRI